ncbi:hypothetical protein ABPG74_017687 [Tetrahymena malaccensis]
MKQLTLSKPQLEKRLNKIVLIICLILCFQEIQAEKLADVLNKEECQFDKEMDLSIQILSHAYKTYYCEQDHKSYLEYENKLDDLTSRQKSYYEIQKAFQNSSKKLKLVRGETILAEYLLYKKFTLKDSSCGDTEILQKLGNSFNDCDYCMGVNFCIRNTEVNDYYSKSNDTQISYIDSKMNVFVEAFQLLWNCNNPNDQVEVTANSESITCGLCKSGFYLLEGKCVNECPPDYNTSQTQCLKCQLGTFLSGEECAQCSASCHDCTDFNICKLCKSGFYLLEGKCVNECPSDYNTSETQCVKCQPGTYFSGEECVQCSEFCQACSNFNICNLCQLGFYLLEGKCVKECPSDYNISETQCIKCQLGTYFSGEECFQCSEFCEDCTGSINCNKCKSGFYLLEGRCVKECPSDYNISETQCVKCQPGTYFSGKICAQCSKQCQKCTGPDFSQCQQCYEGYKYDQTKGCIMSDLNLNISFKPKKYLDPRTKTEKECNFSCDECIDSSDLCKKCNPELNYFIKEGDRFRCYNRCPLYHEPNLSNQNPQSKFIECVLSESYTSDLEAADKIRNEAKSRCPKQQYWQLNISLQYSNFGNLYKRDIQTKQCFKCANNCISCNNDSSCIECEPGYYWNINSTTCSPCHPSCKKCSGPLSKNCLSCASSDKLFPNANGTCDDAAFDPLLHQKILSQNEIYGNIPECKPFLPQNQQQSYSVVFLQKYSTTNSQWESNKMISINTCTFQEFQSRYKYFKKNQLDCQDKEISSSTIGKNGDLVVIYSILLSQSRAQISAKEVNPQTLVEYAISNNFLSTNYVFNPTQTFTCSNLQCISKLDSLLYGFTSSDEKKEITIKTVKDIILTSSKQTPLNCFQDDQQVNQNSVEEIDQIINNSQYTLNTPQKQYFILYLCGKSQTANFVQKPMLVQKSLGNGFFEVLNVSNELPSQVEVISLYGASTEQNAYLKNCDSKLSNTLNSYQVQKVKIVQVIEQDPNTDKSESMFQQYNEKVSNSNTNPSKCSCVETKDYIFANENQGNQFITVITPQNKLLTQSIDVLSIRHILKKHNIDADVMKTNSLSITKIEADLLFQEYIQEIIGRTKLCYGISNSTPLCIINVLSDLLFSNKLECSISQEITSLVKKNDFDKLKDVIKQQNWCDLNQERCLKAQQTIKSCI